MQKTNKSTKARRCWTFIDAYTCTTMYDAYTVLVQQCTLISAKIVFQAKSCVFIPYLKYPSMKLIFCNLVKNVNIELPQKITKSLIGTISIPLRMQSVEAYLYVLEGRTGECQSLWLCANLVLFSTPRPGVMSGYFAQIGSSEVKAIF